jgi:alcohol dehydrogenase
MVFLGPHRGLEMRTFALPSPRQAEVLVRVLCCTLCGSDLHSHGGRRQVPVPTILGHEILGRIEALGPDAPHRDLLGTPLEPGNRITWTLAASCGQCFFCTHELPQKCERLFKYGHEPLGEGRILGGGLADYCMLTPGTGIVRVPDDLDDHAACPANCATATVAAALRRAGTCRGETVLVQGAGMLGLTACAMTRESGATSVICTDVREDRLARALSFGATHVVQAGSNELLQRIQEVTSGRGVDLALELSGAPEAMETGLTLLRIGGRSIWVGAVTPVRPISLEPERFVRRWLTVQGIHNYHPVDLVTAVRFLAEQQHRYPFAELVAGPWLLEDAEQAFRHAQEGAAVRVAVRPA